MMSVRLSDLLPTDTESTVVSAHGSRRMEEAV